MYLQQNSWIFGSETGGDLFFLRSPPPTDFQKKKVMTCLVAENPTILLEVINSTEKKGLELNLSVPFLINCYSLLLLLLILKLEVRL